jgi:hypothetical protein
VPCGFSEKRYLGSKISPENFWDLESRESF